MLSNSVALRLANRLHTAWASRAAAVPDPPAGWLTIDTRLAWARAAAHRAGLARAAKLALIYPHLVTEAAAALTALAREVERLRADYLPSLPRIPDLVEWVAEVRQLEAEFGAVEPRWADSALRVVTDPVVLESFALGPFAIDFAWGQVSRAVSSHCFSVVALDPRPAAGRTDVVHPHVRDAAVCLGDAVEPVRRALTAGRLADAFVLVRAVLTTYNPGSPHVPLDEWDGLPCGDCGDRTDPEDATTCEECGAALCPGCLTCCAACSAIRCGRCTDACEVCRTGCCPGCLETTADSQTVCPDCAAELAPTDDPEDQPHENDERDATDAAAAPAPAG
jgi:hypothetical protein